MDGTRDRMYRWVKRLGDRHISHWLRHGHDRVLTGVIGLRWQVEHWSKSRQFRRSRPLWVYASLGLNVLMVLLTLQLWTWQQRLHQAMVLIQTPPAMHSVAPATPNLGPRRTLTYEQWVSVLEKEARIAAEQQPPRLTVLLGDSISLWFPPDLLQADRTWLNQGISGENSTGLLRRLSLLDETQPETILVMIGINDLLRGDSDALILNNYEQIVQYLRNAHPTTQIVAQSILPHAGAAATWEGRDRLLALSNERIVALNQRIAAIAQNYQAEYLNLYPLFVDEQGNLPMALSTDGLHLNSEGYLVWRSGLQLYFNQFANAEG